MDEKSYTVSEIEEVFRDFSYSEVTRKTFLAKLDKNRSQGFTEEQVRRAVAESVHEVRETHGVTVKVRGLYGMTETFVSDVITRLRGAEKPAEPVEGGVYRSPALVLYKRSGARWVTFGSNARLTDDQLNYSPEDLERVL